MKILTQRSLFTRIVLLMFIVAIFVCGNSFASGVNDVSSMSFDELKNLKMDVDKEWLSREEVAPFQLYDGYYVAGKDIVPGSYYVMYTESKGEITLIIIKDIDTFFSLSSNEATTGYMNLSTSVSLSANGENFKINLDEGNVLYTTGNLFFSLSPMQPSDCISNENK